MLKSKKFEVVEALEDVCKQSNSLIITHYHGLTVNQLETLRKSLKVKGAGFKVVKNTLIKRAFTMVGLENAAHFLSGPTAIAYSEDSIDAAKIIVEFAKTNENLKILAAIVNDQLLNKDAIVELSKLPSLDALRGKIIGLLQAPAAKLVGVLQAPASNFARILQAYSNKN